jgi:hypothetical protein
MKKKEKSLAGSGMKFSSSNQQVQNFTFNSKTCDASSVCNTTPSVPFSND